MKLELLPSPRGVVDKSGMNLVVYPVLRNAGCISLPVEGDTARSFRETTHRQKSLWMMPIAIAKVEPEPESRVQAHVDYDSGIRT
jgi:hypothetical protein